MFCYIFGYIGISVYYIQNSTAIKQSNNRDIAAREAALEHLGIKQLFGYADHARMYDFAERVEDAPIHTIDASVASAPITEYSGILNAMSTPSARHRLSSTPRSLSRAAP